MRILYLANPLQSSTGGDRRSFEVLKRIGSLGVEPVIVVDEFIWQKMKQNQQTQFSPQQKIYSLRRPNVIYDRRFKSASRAALDYYSIHQSARQIAQIAKQEKVDLIVSHHEKIDFLLEAYLAAKQLHLPWTCVFQLPLLPPYASTEWRPIRSIRKTYLRALYAPLYGLIKKAAKTTTFLAVSPAIEPETKKYFPDWRGKMLVLQPGNGIKATDINPIEASEEKIDVFFFSRLAPEKGIFDLPKIAAELAQSDPSVRVVVAGKFDSPIIENRFRQAVKECGVGKNLVYKGFIDKQTLFSYLKSAKVLIYPSLYDSFSLVVLEALTAGTPVVAYDIAAMRLNFPGAVKRVPVGNWKIMAQEAQRLLHDASLRHSASEKGLALAAKFSWDSVAREEHQAYDRIKI
ncbi:MAG: glycosyltransferase family 4 protein [Candidatus Bathyarchaeota archaeon]|nr:glycosyltransferase family 4 protein [Candidatus Bathyarchaeota archaeon]